MTRDTGPQESARDKRDRASASEFAQALHSELIAVVTACRAPLATVTVDLRFQHVNDSFARLYGKEPRHFVGRLLQEVLPECASAAEVAAQRITATGEAINGAKILCSSGAKPGSSEQWLPYKSDAGKVLGFVIVGEEEDLAEPDRFARPQAQRGQTPNDDLDERGSTLEAESRTQEQLRQAQKMEAVGQLAGGIAHDFNNLLTVVAGNLELIASRTPMTEPLRRYLAAAQEALLKGQQRIEHLLSFSRRQRLRFRLTDVLSVFRDGTDLLRRAAGEAIDVQFDLEPQLWPCRVDPVQLETALLNLTLNARDAMPTGGSLRFTAANVTLDQAEARLLDLPAGSSYVKLGVSDSGHGMAREIAARAFEPFFTTKPPGKGTGLGLSMVYGFAKQSGGGAAMKSAPGRGTTVELYLPKIAAAAQVGPGETSREEIATHGAVLVLVVEDDESVLETVSALLADLGYRTVNATSAAEALRTLQRRPRIEVLLTDVVMPGGMSGFELAREVRSLYPGLKILLTSGYAEDALGESTTGEEFVLLRKPLHQASLARALHSLLVAS